MYVFTSLFFFNVVPDDLVAAMVLEELRNSELQGYILRGFPRSITQTDLLSQWGYQPSKVFFFNMPEEVAMERLISRGRELFEKAQNLQEFYVDNERKQSSRFTAGTCPGFHNEDAQLVAIRDQNDVFSQGEEHLREIYKDLLYDINASLPEDDVFAQIKYHLLHSQPLRPVVKPPAPDDDLFDYFITEEVDVEAGCIEVDA